MNNAEPAIKAAIFDIGATLVTGPPVAPNKVIAGLMNGVTAAEVASVIMTTELESAEQVYSVLDQRFGGFKSGSLNKIKELWNSQLNAAVAIDGAADTVLELKNQGIKIGLLSDIWKPYYVSVEKALPQVISCSDSIVLSYKSGARKPNEDNFIKALGELSVKPEEAVMIGDTYTHDIFPAISLGMKSIWVLARPDREAESIIKILNGDCPAPTATVLSICEIVELDLWQAKECINTLGE